jgi:hypothetical protein
MQIGDKVLIKTLGMEGKIIALVPALVNPKYDKRVVFDKDAYDINAVSGRARDEVSCLVMLNGSNPFDVHPPPKKPVVVWPKNESIVIVTEEPPIIEEVEGALPRKRGRK